MKGTQPSANQPKDRVILGNRIILFVLWVIFYGSFTLFSPPLLDDADSVHAEVAREMITRNDWVTLYANGIRYLEKAPLYYWSMAASYRVFGVSAATSRVPLALGVLLLALLLESFARRAFADTRAGLYAGLISLSSFGLFIFSRINIPDVLVCCWLSLALYVFWRVEQQGEQEQQVRQATPARLLCWLFAAACGLNILTKGLIGIVFPIGIVAMTLLATRGLKGGWQRLGKYHLLSSTLLFLAISVPWHVLAALANPSQGSPGGVSFSGGHFSVPLPTDGNVHGWAWFYFINEQVLRYINLRVPRDYDTVPLWLFLGLILVWLLPWSVFLPRAIADAFPLRNNGFRSRLLSQTLTPGERTEMLLLIWAALPLLFFCFSTRQEYYVLPSLPPLILLIANRLCQRADATSGRSGWEAAVILVGGASAAAASAYFLIHSKAPAPQTDLATLLQQNPGDYALSFGHFLDLNARALGLFRQSLWLTLVVTVGGSAAYFLLQRKGRAHAATLALSLATFGFLFAAWSALVIFSPTLSSEQLARALAAQVRPGDLIMIHGEYEAGSTLGFYLKRNDLHLIEGRSSNLWYGSFFPDAPKIFETREGVEQAWPGSRRIFIWEDPSDPDRPPVVFPGRTYVIASSGGKQILSNQANQ